MKNRKRTGRRRGFRPRNRGDRAPTRRNIFSPAYNSLMSTVFRLVTTSTVTSNGSGVVASLLYLDPYSSSFTEHTSDLCNLYNQFRLVGSRIQLVTISEAKGDVAVLGIGYQNRNTGLGTPTSLNLVLDNQPSWLWACSSDTSPMGFIRSQRASNLLYAATSTSSNTSTDTSGAPGGWQFYGAGFPASTNIFLLKAECFYEYRSRS